MGSSPIRGTSKAKTVRSFSIVRKMRTVSLLLTSCQPCSRLWRYYVTPPPNPRPRGGGLVGASASGIRFFISVTILTGFSCFPVSLPDYSLILTAFASFYVRMPLSPIILTTLVPNLVRNTRCTAPAGILLTFLRTNGLYGDVWWVFLLPTPRIISSRRRFRGQNVAGGAERWTSGVILGHFCFRRCKQMYLQPHLSAPLRLP